MKRLLNLIKGIIVALFTLGISIIATLNFNFIYSYLIEKYHLTKIGKISKVELMNDYTGLIKYLQNPFIKKLKFNNFPMSSNGEFHFYEVKKIFLKVYLLVLIIFLVFIILYTIKKFNKKKIEVAKYLNYGANTLIVMIVSIGILIVNDFSDVFIKFHKLFFTNDYWVFDEVKDPIINVLPEEVFKFYAIAILSIVFGAIIIYKSIYYKAKKKNNY